VYWEERGKLKKNLKRKKLVVEPQNKLDISDLISKMQQQLNAMEEKLDTLISQSSKRPFEKSYSPKPFRSFDRSHRHDRERHSNGPRERTYTRAICAECNRECEIPFKPSGDRPVYCSDCFSKRKEGGSFNTTLDNRSGERHFPREHRSDKRQFGKRQEFDKKKKPFFARRKKRV